jgi:hypothetical protein
VIYWPLKRVAIGCFAALPKERQRHNKRVKELTTALDKRIHQYNLLVRQFNAVEPHAARRETSLEALRRHEFTWVNEYSGNSHGSST